MTRKALFWLLGVLSAIALTFATWAAGSIVAFGYHQAEHHAIHGHFEKMLNGIDGKLDTLLKRVPYDGRR